MGGSSHYRAIGDTVNIASRIQGVNKYLGTRILASATIALSLTGVIYRPVGIFRVMGRAEPLALVEIVGRESDAIMAKLSPLQGIRRRLKDHFSKLNGSMQYSASKHCWISYGR